MGFIDSVTSAAKSALSGGEKLGKGVLSQLTSTASPSPQASAVSAAPATSSASPSSSSNPSASASSSASASHKLAKSHYDSARAHDEAAERLESSDPDKARLHKKASVHKKAAAHHSSAAAHFASAAEHSHKASKHGDLSKKKGSKKHGLDSKSADKNSDKNASLNKLFSKSKNQPLIQLSEVKHNGNGASDSREDSHSGERSLNGSRHSEDRSFVPPHHDAESPEELPSSQGRFSPGPYDHSSEALGRESAEDFVNAIVHDLGLARDYAEAIRQSLGQNDRSSLNQFFTDHSFETSAYGAQLSFEIFRNHSLVYWTGVYGQISSDPESTGLDFLIIQDDGQVNASGIILDNPRYLDSQLTFSEPERGLEASLRFADENPRSFTGQLTVGQEISVSINGREGQLDHAQGNAPHGNDLATIVTVGRYMKALNVIIRTGSELDPQSPAVRLDREGFDEAALELQRIDESALSEIQAGDWERGLSSHSEESGDRGAHEATAQEAALPQAPARPRRSKAQNRKERFSKIEKIVEDVIEDVAPLVLPILPELL